MITLHIKNMVCDRCKIVVRQELGKMGLTPLTIALGEVTIEEDQLTDAQQTQLDAALVSVGFERIDDRKERIIESIKNIIIKQIRQQGRYHRKFNWSHVLAEHLHLEYSYISSLFSSAEGITLEHYIIRQKIEYVKELLFNDELTLSQIAIRMDYSSVAHLSAQFKKITGVTPSEFKKSDTQSRSRQSLDAI
jgi:AraC-like DNA-binding protein